MQPRFKKITLTAELSESESSFSESISALGEAYITLQEARRKALDMVDRMFPDEEELNRILGAVDD